MGGYSKMRVGQGNRSRSIDFSDLSLSQFSKENPDPVSSAKNRVNPEKEKTQKVIAEAEREEEDGQRFGAILSRNMSVSADAAAAASRRFGSENQSNVKSAVGRAFSMRRSSSVGEGYCRIHNQCEILSPPPDNLNPSGRSGRRRTKLLRAWKKLFRLF